MVDHIVQYGSYKSTHESKDSDYERKLSNYKLYNNQINQSDFERHMNPFGLNIGQNMVDIMPYNKTPNKIQVLLGEEIKTPFRFRTVLVNSEGIRAKELHKKELLKKILTTEIQSVIAQIKGSESEDTSDLIDPRELEHYMSYTYQEAREKLASDMLKYLIRKDQLKEKKNEAFKHGLLSGEEIIWVGVVNGEPTVEVVNPLNFFFHKSDDKKYIEDSLFAGYKTKMTAADVLDRFGDDLDEDDKEMLEGTLGGMHNAFPDWYKNGAPVATKGVYEMFLTGSGTSDTSVQGAYSDSISADIPVTHVEWKSQMKVGFLKYMDPETGQEEQDIVSEDFVIPTSAVKENYKNQWGRKKTRYVWNGATLEWDWIPQVWQAVKIGANTYANIGPKEYQYRSLENPYKVPLGYYGAVYNNLNANSVSLMDRMKPFQYLYFVIMDKLLKLVAADQGKVYQFDISQFPDQLGLEKTLYYMKELNINFYDPLKNAELPGSSQRSGAPSGVADMSNMQNIMGYVQLLEAIDMQIADVAGITRQREGQIGGNELVSNAQANIMQSSTITEATYFYPHERIWENALNAVVQCAISCWRNKSIIKQYVLDDLSTATLKISPDLLTNMDIGVFVSSLVDDEKLFLNIQNLAQPLIQNDKANFSDIIKLFKATSSTELEKHIQSSEKAFADQQMQQIQAQQQAQQAQTEAMMQLEREKMMNQRVIALATSSEEGRLALEKMIHEDEMALEMTKLKMEAQQAELDRQSKEKIAASKPKPTTKK